MRLRSVSRAEVPSPRSRGEGAAKRRIRGACLPDGAPLTRGPLSRELFLLRPPHELARTRRVRDSDRRGRRGHPPPRAHGARADRLQGRRRRRRRRSGVEDGPRRVRRHRPRPDDAEPRRLRVHQHARGARAGAVAADHRHQRGVAGDHPRAAGGAAVRPPGETVRHPRALAPRGRLRRRAAVKSPHMTPYGSDRARVDGERIVLSSRLPKGWTARVARTLTSAEFPGTAVLWEEQYFEVVGAEPLPAGVRYTLEPWCDHHAMRVTARYDDDSEVALLAVTIAYIVSEYMTHRSTPTWAVVVSAFLFFETAFRFLVVWTQGRPAGSTLGLLTYILYWLLTGRREETSPFDRQPGHG